MEEPLINENICCICLEICSTKTSCKCNSFIHSHCEKEMEKKWKRDCCPYCMIPKKPSLYKKIKRFSLTVYRVIVLLIITPFMLGALYNMNNQDDSDYDLEIVSYLLRIWWQGLIIEAVIGIIILSLCCYEAFNRYNTRHTNDNNV